MPARRLVNLNKSGDFGYFYEKSGFFYGESRHSAVESTEKTVARSGVLRYNNQQIVPWGEGKPLACVTPTFKLKEWKQP